MSEELLEIPAANDPPPGRDAEWERAWPQTEEAFAAMVEAYQDRLVRYAFVRLRDLHDAEDAIQEVFLKAYRMRRERANVTRIGPYLYRMAASACTDLVRRRKRITVSIEEIGPADDPIDPRPAARHALAARQEIEQAEALLAHLPWRQAEVIRLHVYDELTLTQIAEVAGCPLPTVKSRLRYGLAKLRRWITADREVNR